MELTFREIARASSGRLFSGDPLRKIKGISIDSRTIKSQELFIPLKGEHSDGHKFLREVKKKKAAAALVRKNYPFSKIPQGLSFIRVTSPLKALGDIAAYYRSKFNIPVISITGSSGKTTVKEMAAHILSSRFHVLKTEGNFNNEIGLPLTLFRLNYRHEVAVLEMGMNRPGEIGYLTRISRPCIGLITNINPVHLEGLGSVNGVYKAKQELLLNLPEGSKAILNYDDRRLRKMGRSFPGEVITFGLERHAHFRADELKMKEVGTSFRLNGKESFFLPLLGRGNLYNALAAIAIAALFKVHLKEMKDALLSVERLPQRLEVSEIRGLKIIDDTYNANPVSFQLAIEVLKSFGGRGRDIIVAGDMLELGSRSSKAHFRLGYYIGKMGIDYLVTIGRWKNDVRDGAGRGGIKKGHTFTASSHKDIARIILNIARPCDKILFKASRKIGLEGAINVLSSSLSSL